MKTIFTVLMLGAVLHTGVTYAKKTDLPTDLTTDLTIGLRLEPPHLDPTASASASIDFIVYNNVFEGLTTIDKNGNIRPLLATKWDISADGKTYIFTLKPHVKFHDGTDFTASDVVYTMHRITAPDTLNPRKSMFTHITNVAALNDSTVKITLKNPDSHLLYKLALPEAVMVAPESANTNKTAPIGTGAFIFNRFSKGDSVTLSKNTNYHNPPAKLSTVKFRFISDTTAATAGILSGQIDAFPYFVDPINIQLFKNNPKFSVVYGNTEGETMVAINNQNIADVRIRRAMHHAIDKQGIIHLTAPGATPIGSHMPPHSPYYIDLTAVYPYDVQTAKQLLTEANAHGTALKFLVPPAYDLMANGVADYLRKAGFKIHMQSVDWATWLSQVFQQKQYDITVITHVEPMDYDIYANPEYYYGYNSPAYQQLIADVKTAPDEPTKSDLLAKAQKLLSTDAVNVWLYQRPKIGVWHKDLIGMWSDAPVEGIVLKNVYWQ